MYAKLIVDMHVLLVISYQIDWMPLIIVKIPLNRKNHAVIHGNSIYGKLAVHNYIFTPIQRKSVCAIYETR